MSLVRSSKCLSWAAVLVILAIECIMSATDVLDRTWRTFVHIGAMLQRAARAISMLALTVSSPAAADPLPCQW